MQWKDVLVRVWSFKKEIDCACLNQRQKGEENQAMKDRVRATLGSRTGGRTLPLACSISASSSLKIQSPGDIILLAFLGLPLH